MAGLRRLRRMLGHATCWQLTRQWERSILRQEVLLGVAGRVAFDEIAGRLPRRVEVAAEGGGPLRVSESRVADVPPPVGHLLDTDVDRASPAKPFPCRTAGGFTQFRAPRQIAG
jgi:hypothetical protein